MLDDIDETTLQTNANLSAELPGTDDATPGTAPGGPGLGSEDQVVGLRGAATSPQSTLPNHREDATRAADDRSSSDRSSAAREASQEREQASKRPTYLTLMGIFLTVLAFFARSEQRTGDRGRIGGYNLALLSLGTYRLARLLAFDQVTEPLRAPVVDEKPGGKVEPKRGGIRGSLGEMVSCPTCIGTWIAAALTYAFRLVPAPTRLFLAIVSASAFAEILNYAVNTIDNIGKAAAKRAETTG